MDIANDGKLDSLRRRKESLSKTISIKTRQIEGIQEQLDKYNDTLADIVAQMDELSNDQMDGLDDEVRDTGDRDIDVEMEEDAATTTAALDAASTSLPDASGWKSGSGWKVYKKIGPLLRRNKPEENKCKKTTCESTEYGSFIDTFGGVEE